MAFQKETYFCWLIVWTFIVPVTCEDCPDENAWPEYKTKLENILDDIFYEIVDTQKSWEEANETCVERGGKLLQSLNCEIKALLLNLATKIGKSQSTFWVGQGLLGTYKEMTTSSELNIKKLPLICTVMSLEPFQVITMRKCTYEHRYICTLDLSRTSSASQEGSGVIEDSGNVENCKRRKRDANSALSGMQSGDINTIIKHAELFLHQLEQNPGDVTYDQRVQYLEALLKGVNVAFASGSPNLLLQNTIINCTGGMVLSALERCGGDGLSFKQFEGMLSLAVDIYIALYLNSGIVVGEDIVIETQTATVYISRQLPAGLDSKVIGAEDGANFKLPSFAAMESQIPEAEYIDVEMYKFHENPLHADSNESITGSVCSLNLSTSTASVPISGLSEYVEFFLPRPGANQTVPVAVAVAKDYSLVITVNLTDPDLTTVLTMTPNVNVTLSLLIYKPDLPPEDNDNTSTILGPEGDYRWFIRPDMVGEINQTMTVTITPVNFTFEEELELLVSSFTTKCMYWDTDLKSWNITGCMVGPKSLPNMTHCLCNHLTFFGSSFFVMPNQIDLTKTAELFATISENFVVAALLGAFFGFYLIILMWACYADRMALRKRKMTLLDDNHPCAHYNYMLTVQTGHRSGAGTSAQVTAIIRGAEWQCKPHVLTDPDKPVFERGGVDMFLVTTPFPMGELQSIELAHDNTGGHPAWYVNRILVQDMQTKQSWQFLCSSWLRSDKGDMLTKRTFNTAKKNEIASFGNIFSTRTSSGFRDEHIWMSVVDPPRRSPFTRAQRVSCCMSLLLCTMAINIMFWNLPVDSDSPVILQLGSFEMTWQQFMVGVESALFMFPINILIITIFRKIKPRITPLKDRTQITNEYKAPAVSLQTVLKDMEEMVNLLSKSPRNQVPALENKLESSSDLSLALDRVHGVIQIMQESNEVDPHLSYCSRFVFYCLCHLSMQLDKLGEKSFHSPEEHQHISRTVSLLLKMCEMVTCSHTVQNTPVVAPPKKASSWSLPWWFVFVGWFLLVAMSIVSTYFTLIYGLHYGKESSIQWVISLTLSLFQSIFVLQPLKVVAVAIFFAIILRPVAVEENEDSILLLEEQRERCKLYSGKDMC